MAMTQEPVDQYRDTGIDFYAKEAMGGKLVELRYRLFPGRPNLAVLDAERFLTTLIEGHNLPLNHRYFALLDPFYEMTAHIKTDLEAVSEAKGQYETLTTSHVMLDVAGWKLHLPVYNQNSAKIGEEVTVIMDFDASDPAQTREAHERLAPFTLTASPERKIEKEDLKPARKLVIFLDPEMRESLEKYPNTIGKERLIIQSLGQLYPTLDKWKAQVQELEDREISSWRKSRGDGNCYFRSVAAAYLESMLRQRRVPELQQLLLRIYNQADYTIVRGFEQHHVYFYDRLYHFLEEYKESPAVVKDFQPVLMDDAFDAAMTGVFRNLAADWLQRNQNRDEIFPFVMDEGIDAVIRLILSDEKEAEGIAFCAMANALQVTVRHISVDKSGENVREDTFTPFSEKSEVEVTIMLRPGHYDILYHADEDELDGYDCYTQQFNK